MDRLTGETSHEHLTKQVLNAAPLIMRLNNFTDSEYAQQKRLKKKKKVVRPKACSAKKSGPTLAGPAGPPMTALQSLTFLTDHYSVLFLGTQDGARVDIWCTGTQVSFITKTRLYNFDPLKPHFYIVKLRFTGVYIIFHISAQNIDCGYPLEPPRRGGSNEYPQSMF